MSHLIIDTGSPVCEALGALLAARDAVISVETMLGADTVDLLMWEIQCTADELCELHERSAGKTVHLLAHWRGA